MSDDQGAAGNQSDGRAAVAAIFAPGVSEAWIPTIRSLQATAPDLPILVGGPDMEDLLVLERLGVEVSIQASASSLVNHAYAKHSAHVLLVHAPALFPPDFLDRALTIVDTDLRCSSVSFLSNIAGYAGFPHPDQISLHQIDDLDEVAITRRLRAHPEGLEAVPIPYPVGPAVLVSAQGLSIVWPFPDRGERVPVSLADFGASTRIRGLISMLDPGTFVSRPTDVLGSQPPVAGLAPAEEAWLEQHYPGITRAPNDPSETDSALRQALVLARANTFGMRIVLEGSCLGPKEMGSQVALLAMAAALADRDDVSYLGVAIPGPIPPYAVPWLSNAKIDVRTTPVGEVTGFPAVDIVHRPFQVTPGVDPSAWRAVGKRTVITVHDLIAFQIPVYHETADLWFDYRSATRSSTAAVDGIIASSEDTARQIGLERLSIDEQRVFVVPAGVDHLRGDEPEREPVELLARGFGGQPFMLVLGTNYTHKNRDLAIRVAHELGQRGFGLALVMAGALVPFGSSRMAESIAWSPGDPVFTIPDVTSEERNWLLRHAELVLYPSGAEGFGFIPHEAAAFGTPTVVVPFGPFEERMSGLPVVPADWSVDALADACVALLSDPALSEAQVEGIAAGMPVYDWKRCAESLMYVYRSLLVRPPLSSL
jgi:glycosyltransferase involved in cell wall biosynthesis